MTFKSYHTGIFLRVFILSLLLAGAIYFGFKKEWVYCGVILLFCVFTVYRLFRFLSLRFEVIDDFFESVKYRDFSRSYIEENKTADIKTLYKGFNKVNQVVREINSEKETQYLYLQKILEMIDIGIIAYEMDSGRVLWVNESFQNTMDFPSFKNISFIASRNAQAFELLFKKFYPKPTAVELIVQRENIKVLASNSLFKIQGKSYKLIVIHNIEETLNKTESDAWKKLLSVMTHEIMNSIAPISSLANTLKLQVQGYQNDPKNNMLEIEDLDAGLGSIEKRSEGLMKFAKTYRSLNKVTSLNLEKIRIKDLFRNIEHLMKPLIHDKKLKLQYKLSSDDLEIEADAYLVEQVLINLILNAVEACENTPEAFVYVIAEQKIGGKVFIRVIDNGPGISEEISEEVFVPFFTTKKDGSGIGLSLSKQIMLLHGGKIQLSSNSYHGATVSLSFQSISD